MKLHVVGSLIVPLIALCANAEENPWGASTEAKVEAAPQAPAKAKVVVAKKKPKAHADGVSASSTDEGKIVPSPLNLPSAVANPPPSAPPVIPGTLKFSGFSDFRYTAYTSPIDSNAHALSGFGLEDGAMTATYEVGAVLLTADLSFRRFKDSDGYDPRGAASTTQSGQSSTSRINFAADCSQLFLKYKASDNLAFDLGQFDTIFGVEAAEARGRTFSKTALLTGALPVVITGVMVENSTNGLSEKVFASNPNNRGNYGTSAAGDDNTEYGGAVGYSNDTVQAQLGIMNRPITPANGVGRGDRMMLDFSGGLTLGKFSMNAEVLRIDDPSKNTLTSSNSSDRENAGFGYLGIFNYKIDDINMVGARVERLVDDPSGASLQEAASYGIALHHRLHQNVDLATELISYDYKNTSGLRWTERLFNVGAIISF